MSRSTGAATWLNRSRIHCCTISDNLHNLFRLLPFSIFREITNGSRINSRSLTALRSSGQSSPAQFNTPLNSRSAGPDPQKATTPFGSTAGRIARVARPHFSTPYRQSGVFGARNSSEGSSLGSEAPSAKKPRLSAPSGLLETDHTGAPLKFEIKVGPSRQVCAFEISGRVVVDGKWIQAAGSWYSW